MEAAIADPKPGPPYPARSFKRTLADLAQAGVWDDAGDPDEPVTPRLMPWRSFCATRTSCASCGTTKTRVSGLGRHDCGSRSAHQRDDPVREAARVRGCVLVTRNLADCRGRGVRLLNPFEAGPAIEDV
ncbi:MAG: hypothetical protein K2X71_26410 [Methylobacterium sp.]|uniref:hypothetical protein n=1 Tax=Methylobacterium sp. TaxID=409 RepID=UPI0025836544|nr:hypothetical protein [Methylobacterium sp.]MBY0299523.1 hypothetical protein [Methylobacterium sp.]